MEVLAEGIRSLGCVLKGILGGRSLTRFAFLATMKSKAFQLCALPVPTVLPQAQSNQCLKALKP